MTVTPHLAEMVTDWFEVTVVVVIPNVAVVPPAATVIDAGTCAVVRLLVRVTTIPPEGAGLFKVTVPVDGFPPLTVVGLKARADAVGAVTVRVALRVTVL